MDGTFVYVERGYERPDEALIVLLVLGGLGGTAEGPFLAIPWLLIAVIVVALPLLTAAVVGLSARPRLPLVARLD